MVEELREVEIYFVYYFLFVQPDSIDFLRAYRNFNLQTRVKI